jgi:hypothetical protein
MCSHDNAGTAIMSSIEASVCDDTLPEFNIGLEIDTDADAYASQYAYERRPEVVVDEDESFGLGDSTT